MSEKQDNIRAAFTQWYRNEFGNRPPRSREVVAFAAYAQGRADVIASMKPVAYMIYGELRGEIEPSGLYFLRNEADVVALEDGGHPVDALAVIPKE